MAQHALLRDWGSEAQHRHLMHQVVSGTSWVARHAIGDEPSVSELSVSEPSVSEKDLRLKSRQKMFQVEKDLETVLKEREKLLAIPELGVDNRINDMREVTGMMLSASIAGERISDQSLVYAIGALSATAQRANTDRVDALEKELLHSRTENKKLQSSVDQLKQEKDQLHTRVKTTEQSAKRFQAEKDRAEGHIGDFKTAIQRLKKDSLDNALLAEQTTKALESSTAEVKRIETVNRDLDQQYVSRGTQIADLERQLELARKEIETRRENEGELRELVEILEQQFRLGGQYLYDHRQLALCVALMPGPKPPLVHDEIRYWVNLKDQGTINRINDYCDSVGYPHIEQKDSSTSS